MCTHTHKRNRRTELKLLFEKILRELTHVPLTSDLLGGGVSMLRKTLAISPVCPRHCSIEFMKQVLPRFTSPTRPPDSGNSAREIYTHTILPLRHNI